MDTKQKSTYSKEARRKKNKRFNTVLYIIAGLLVVAGIVIILSDTTYIFNGIIDPDNYGVDIPLPTGSFTIVTPRPDEATPGPDDTSDPGSPDAPHFTLPPGATLPPETPTPQPTATPSPLRPLLLRIRIVPFRSISTGTASTARLILSVTTITA